MIGEAGSWINSESSCGFFLGTSSTSFATHSNMASSKAAGAFKFQEFAAHSSAVRCAAIGRKSNQVIATGGEDRKVNVWAVGKPQPVLRLTGHTSSVECVAFDAEEEVRNIVVACC